MFLSEKTNKQASGSDKDQLRPANASAMLCKCNKFFEAENKHFSLRTEIMIHVGYNLQISFSVSFLFRTQRFFIILHFAAVAAT